MPETTDIFAIPYPCETDLITTAVLNNYALGVDNALSTVWTDANSALGPPAVAVFNNAGQSVSTGVITTMTFAAEAYDRGAMWTNVSPTIVTIPSAGSYFLSSTTSGNLTGNVTSVRWAFLRNGTEIAYWETQSSGAVVPASNLNLTVLAVACSPGDQITQTILYTGTQPTLTFFGRITATRLSIF